MTEATALPEPTTAPDGTSTTLSDWSRSDRVAAATAFLETIYETETDHDDAVLGIHHLTGRAFKSQAARFDDLSEAAARLVDLSDRHETYYRVGRCRPGIITELARGTADDTVGITALQLDLDVQTGDSTHASDALPTLEQAQALLAALPLDTYQVWTGGGIHAYVLLSEELDPAADDLDLLQRWRALVLREAANAGGYHVDRRPLADPAAVLRVPGTLRRKTVPPTVVTVLTEQTTRYTLDDVSEVLPDIDEVADIVRGSIPEVTTTVSLDDISPVWATEPPTPKSAEVLTGWLREALERLASTQKGARHDAALLAGISMGNWVAGGVLDAEWATAAIRAAQAAGGHDVRGHQQTVADGIAIGVKRPRGWDYLRVSQPLRGVVLDPPPGAAPGQTSGDLPDGQHRMVQLAGSEGLSDADTQSLTEALSDPTLAWASGAHQMAGRGSWYACRPGDGDVAVRGSETGIWTQTWKEAKDESGETVWVAENALAAPFLMWRSRQVIEGQTVRYIAEVIAPDGRRWETPPLDPEDSLSPSRVIARSGAEVSVPSDHLSRAACTNALSMLAARERSVERPQRHPGWGQLPDGTWAYLGVLGSICPDGITHDARAYAVEYDDGGEVDIPAMARMGWSETDSLVDDPAGLWAAWRAVLTGEAKLGYSLLLLAVAVGAPLGIRQQGGIVMTASHGVGKSAVALCLQSLWADTEWGAEDGVGVYLPAVTKALGRTRAGWWAYLLCILDDLRKDDTTSDKLASMALQAATGGDSGSVSGERSGTEKRLGKLRAPALVTGERPPRAGAAIMSRAVHIHLGTESTSLVDTSIGGGLDAFRDDWYETGRARGVFGGYLRWLCVQMRDRTEWAPDGTPASLAATARQRVKTHRKALARVAEERGDRSGRAETLGGFYLVAWECWRAYAESVGQADDLPSMAEAQDAVLEALTGSRAAAASQSTGEVILAGLREAITSGRMHVVAEDGRRPRGLEASQTGWPARTSAEDDFDRPPHTDIAAHLTADGHVAIVSTAAATRILQDASDARVRPDGKEVEQALADRVVSGITDASGRALRGQHRGRVRGIPVRATDLDLDVDPGPPAGGDY